jgi:hypothetical protein
MKHAGRVVFLLWIVFLAASACSKKSSTDPAINTVEDLLLKSDAISGWSRSGSGWVANNDQQLFEGAIDGAAPDYIQNGFEEGAGQNYTGRVKEETTNIELRVFDMGQASNALAMFTFIRNKMLNVEVWSTTALDTSCVERSTISQSIIGAESKYFIYVIVTSSLSEALDVGKMFASNVGTKID